MLELLLDPGLLLAELRATFEAGGFVMPPLAVGTVLLWYVLGVRAVTLDRGDLRPLAALLAFHRGEALAGRDVDVHGIVATAAARASRYMAAPHRPRARHSLMRRMDELFADLEADMHRGRSLVHSVVVTAPLLGLLGTVTGMVETFASLAEMALFSQGGGVAGGVAQALLTTQVGLVVAIPGIFADRLLARKQRRLQAELDELKELVCNAQGALVPVDGGPR